MVGFSEKAHQLGFRKFSDIPEHLVYEEWDGVPILYKGVSEYARQNYNLNQFEMGSSIFQSLIVEYILGILFISKLDRKKYAIVTNEPGLHLGYRNNISNDIAIIERDLIQNKRSVKYGNTPPKVAIEVDVKADFESDFENFNDYIQQKTQKLLDFGVEKVIWILSSDLQEVRVATQKETTIHTWTETIEILEGVTFCLNDMDLS
ncbi:MAG: Uma2 family endonuclease [Arcicella sp.]|jgi:Uma2 family endonuclease|nr:Uma2 family endonuclease [Arcicella sp.]